MAPKAPEDGIRLSIGMLTATPACLATRSSSCRCRAGKTTSPRPVENTVLPSQSPAAAEVPERPGSEQRSAAAPSELSSTPASRVLTSQAGTESTSQGDEPAVADRAVAPDEPIAVPAAAVVATAVQTNNAPARPNPEHRQIVILDRSGVNIRSAPSASSRVVGSAPKGTRFEVTNREGGWVEIESEAVKGWVSGHFLGPDQPGERR
jgi:hypothetical protein